MPVPPYQSHPLYNFRIGLLIASGVGVLVAVPYIGSYHFGDFAFPICIHIVTALLCLYDFMAYVIDVISHRLDCHDRRLEDGPDHDQPDEPKDEWKPRVWVMITDILLILAHGSIVVECIIEWTNFYRYWNAIPKIYEGVACLVSVIFLCCCIKKELDVRNKFLNRQEQPLRKCWLCKRPVEAVKAEETPSSPSDSSTADESSDDGLQTPIQPHDSILNPSSTGAKYHDEEGSLLIDDTVDSLGYGTVASEIAVPTLEQPVAKTVKKKAKKRDGQEPLKSKSEGRQKLAAV